MNVTASGTVKIKGAKNSIRLANKAAAIAALRSVTRELVPKGSKPAATAAFTKIHALDEAH